MKIHVHALCWNERYILPFFLRHYEQFADKIIVHDNGSDDGSLDILRPHPLVEIRPFDTGGQKRNNVQRDIKNTCWRGSDADWVLLVDADEFVYHPHLPGLLRETDAAILEPYGFEMTAARPPDNTMGQIYDAAPVGFRNLWFDKPVILRPSRVPFISYTAGAHLAETCEPHPLRRRDEQLKLLHYSWLGLDYIQAKMAKQLARLSDEDVRAEHGHKYRWSPEKCQQYLEPVLQQNHRPLCDSSRAWPPSSLSENNRRFLAHRLLYWAAEPGLTVLAVGVHNQLSRWLVANIATHPTAFVLQYPVDLLAGLALDTPRYDIVCLGPAEHPDWLLSRLLSAWLLLNPGGALVVDCDAATEIAARSFAHSFARHLQAVAWPPAEPRQYVFYKRSESSR